MMNRKGNLMDPMLIVLMLFLLSLVVVFSYIVVDEMEGKFEGKLVGESDEIMDESVSAIQLFDYAYIIILGGLIMFSIISAFFIKSHPVLFIASTVLMFIFLIPAAVISNVFDDIGEKDKVADAMTNFGLIDYFSGKYPWIMAVSFILILISLYMYKGRDSGGGDYYT